MKAPTDLQKRIQQAMQDRDPADLVRAMGYRNKKSQSVAIQRLKQTIEDPWLGLGAEGKFDLLYGSVEFLRTLANLLMIDPDAVEQGIAEIERLYQYDRSLYRRKIIIQTNFKRESEPIFVLAFASSLRYIPLSQEINYLPEEECIVAVGKIIRSHYQETGGSLLIWGTITHYLLNIGEGRQLVFDTNGELDENRDPGSQFSATLTLKGRDITTVMPKPEE